MKYNSSFGSTMISAWVNTVLLMIEAIQVRLSPLSSLTMPSHFIVPLFARIFHTRVELAEISYLSGFLGVYDTQRRQPK
jgi:hypothetical protein